MPRALAVTLSVLGLSLAACAGPPFAAPIEGEPTCPDFELGAAHDKMQGALKYPVEVRILEGKTQMQKMVVVGNPVDDKAARTYLPDGDFEYTITWAQCSNEWAPRLVGAHVVGNHRTDSAHYECGEGTVYKTDKFETKKRARDTHKLKFVTPPNPACWASEVPAEPPAPPKADDPAPSAEPSTSAAAPPPATASASAAPAVSASAKPAK